MSATALLREAKERDARTVIELWTEAYVGEGEGGRTLPYSRAEFLETARHAQVFVAEQAGVIVGVVALSRPGSPGHAVARENEAELSRLVVVASARGRGVGRALAEHCEELAMASGWSAIALWSRPYQRAAHRLYESLGYRRLPGRDRTDESGHKRLVFRLTL